MARHARLELPTNLKSQWPSFEDFENLQSLLIVTARWPFGLKYATGDPPDLEERVASYGKTIFDQAEVVLGRIAGERDEVVEAMDIAENVDLKFKVVMYTALSSKATVAGVSHLS